MRKSREHVVAVHVRGRGFKLLLHVAAVAASLLLLHIGTIKTSGIALVMRLVLIVFVLDIITDITQGAEQLNSCGRHADEQKKPRRPPESQTRMQHSSTRRTASSV